MTQEVNLQEIADKVKFAASKMAEASSEQKNNFLHALARNLKANQNTILLENQSDVKTARSNGLSESLIDRLSLENRLDGIILDIEKVISLPDPVGELFDRQKLANGLEIVKRRTPIGVLGIIYESRPNVTIDVSTLTIKSGNCAILRGGSETVKTNIALAEIIGKSLMEASLPAEAIQLIRSPDRTLVKQMLRLHEQIDLIIPRGSAELHQFCRENSTIPVITGGIGICHLFVDETVDVDRSLKVILNAKTQRPTVCNALDTLLVHAKIGANFIPKVVELLAKSGVEFRLDPQAMSIILDSASRIMQGNLACRPAGPQDWDTEWLSLILGIKIVQNLPEAIAHIRKHSSGHSDGILTENRRNGEEFIKSIDSAAVYMNASTRFTDGAQFGLGAEVAISTQKLHARGPMGVKELTTYKWVVVGDYHVRPE